MRSDLDTLILPLLKMLYSSNRRTPSQMYMLLIILLVFSQDTAFATNVHKCGSMCSDDGRVCRPLMQLQVQPHGVALSPRPAACRKPKSPVLQFVSEEVEQCDNSFKSRCSAC